MRLQYGESLIQAMLKSKRNIDDWCIFTLLQRKLTFALSFYGGEC